MYERRKVDFKIMTQTSISRTRKKNSKLSPKSAADEEFGVCLLLKSAEGH
jgi:hypothetical protein